MIFNYFIIASICLVMFFSMSFAIILLMRHINRLNDRIKTNIVYLFNLYPHRKVKYINSFCEELLGYSISDFYKIHSLMESLIYKEDWPVFEFMLRYPELSNKPLVMRMTKKDGTVIWTEHRYSPIKNSAGMVTSVEGFIKDVTEEKIKEFSIREGEEKFKELFDHANDLLFLLKNNPNNDKYEILDLNKIALKTISYERSGIINTDIMKYIKLDFVSIFRKNIIKTIDKGNASFEMFLTSLHGNEILLDINTSYFRLNNERVILLIGRDITEKRKIEHEMEKSQRLESLGVLSGGIAHDFNNFLTAILGNISLMRIQLKDDNPMLENVVEVEHSVYKAKELTHRLLSCSKGFSPLKVVGDIGKIIRESALFISRGTGMKCEIDIEPNMFYSEFDEGQIVQVINNLVINASQAMHDAGILNITTKKIVLTESNSLKLDPGEYNVFLFKDEGRGIFPEDLERIFDPFFTTKATGTGLGLTSSFSIMRKHNGTLTVDSQIGYGACFNMYIPAVSIEKGNQIINIKVGEKIKEIVKGEGSILLMDDNEDIRTMSKTMLTFLGYKVDLAPDGETAIKMYKLQLETGRPYGVVILDLTIQGGMGGKETIKNLLAIDSSVKAVVSSGYSEDNVMSEYKRYGFLDFIVKPYKIEDLSKILNKIINY